jgi:hypothetical protein
MASAPAARSVADLTELSKIVNRDQLRRLLLSRSEPDTEQDSKRVAAAIDKIESHPRLSKFQKDDLKHMLKFSPDPERTAEQMKVLPDLLIAYYDWEAGFDFFIHGGRGKGMKDIQVC